MRGWPNSLFFSLLWLALACGAAHAQATYDQSPINYHDTVADDPVSQLQEQLDSGTAALTFDSERGYLPSLLEALNISPKSQLLVFSKTSLQVRRISRHRPRAIYFDDETYVGWVQGGDTVEISTTDPQLGAVFYTLNQTEAEKPRFVRDQGQCLTCHASTRTRGVPGHLLRSVFVDEEGQPQVGSSTYNTSPKSPFSQRGGGWYLSGTHGGMRHMGNQFIARKHDLEALDREVGANVTDLSDLVSLAPYVTPHSDLIAHMVLTHQVQVHNALTHANHESRSALNHDQVMNQALDRPEDFQSESTQRRIVSAGDRLLKALLSADEFPLESPVSGTSGFTEYFEKLDPLDKQGRSLRQLDLKTRLFRYPCSYLIRSRSFAGLPAPMKTYVLHRLAAILDGTDEDSDFAHLTAADRSNLRELLVDLLPASDEKSAPAN